MKRVRETIDVVAGDAGPRETIFLAQTPQGFRRDVLAAAVALGQSGVEATDEAALAERAGYAVHVVAGESSNIKITTAEDLDAGASKRCCPARTGRAGIGYDLHRLVAGRPLILGGVTIPSERGALGHSDADVVCHAVTDAILGAAVARRHRPAFSRLRSPLERCAQPGPAAAGRGDGRGERIRGRQRRRDRDARSRRSCEATSIEIRASLATVLGIEADRISVKAKTNEGVDAIGRGEAIAAQAIALLRSR